jgi:hypothetical protein
MKLLFFEQEVAWKLKGLHIIANIGAYNDLTI